MYRCPDCRTRRRVFTDLLRHQRASGHRLCTCHGYHFAHRPGSRCCRVNPMAAYHLARRYTDDAEVLAEIAIDCALFVPGRPSRRCPF